MINLNDAFRDDLYFQYLRDPDSVSPEWREYFEKVHGVSVSATDKNKKAPQKKKKDTKTGEQADIKEFENLEPLSNISSRIAANMEDSLEVPTATSVRTIPVKALDENRRIINKYLVKLKRPKVSFTHILLWAVVRALVKYPQMNDAYIKKDGVPYRIKRKNINTGLAVDLEKKDGSRLLLVPNVKNTQDLLFSEFIEAFNVIIDKTRKNQVTLDDLMDTSVTLTNPGMIGTSFSSPRLMKGQGLIVATGSIDYPTEFQAVRPEVLTTLAVSKVVTITSTYDHRIIQGAESAEFLAYINKLLIGQDLFYDQIFASLKIPFEPVRWAFDSPAKDRFGILDPRDIAEKGAHVMLMINAYRVRGHLLASINPLGLESYYYPELDPAYYGFTIWDLDRVFHADDSWDKSNLPLRDIIELVRETYCGPIGVEFMHIQAPDRKEWIKKTLELTRNTSDYTKEEKIDIYKKLIEAETFENFLHTKFVGHKRFSLEGSESVIVLLDSIFDKAADSDLNSVVLGMAHRGRLTVLSNIIGKSPSQIFDEFDEKIDSISYLGSGDVKYHLGDKGDYVSNANKSIPIVLAPNPSHLELVNPVIEGMARAYEDEINDSSYSQVLPVLVHGDAAFAGQGTVAETLNLSQLKGYSTGGTIHVIINNQIGFTTSAIDARSSYYATDVAKMIQIPIIHVNGNDPEAVRTAATLAYNYRNKFKCDVIIDLLSYRKFGHNEADEPTYTQPLLYKKIKSMQPVRKIYEDELIKENLLTSEEAKKYIDEAKEELETGYTNRTGKRKRVSKLITYKQGEIFKPVKTSVPVDKIKKIADALTSVPDGFQPNPKVLSLLKKREEMTKSEEPAIDWAMAEALAFGSILLDGNGIRFSGQDTNRGTFSQRHATLVNISTEESYIPLNNIPDARAKIHIFDSPLSEVGVLGFEYGYSVVLKDGLTLWEAQFGDFANGAQAIIDQFLAPAEAKWGQSSGIVLLLPHGYDGQGPEHSSARLERYLQLCADENMIVCNLSTPAQYFHLLRRQVNMPFNKPLVIMTPKSMLRNPMAVSSITDLSKGAFYPVIADKSIRAKNKVKRAIMCSGKVYYDLENERTKNKIKDIPIIRIEQLYPLDIEMISDAISTYPNLEELVWVQEEPQNMGAWHHILINLIDHLPSKVTLKYTGRAPGASTATGSFKKHVAQQQQLVNEAFGR